MNLHVVNTGLFKLDGGAMFGVVPKTIWQKTNPADSNNLCTWAMRSLLVEDGQQLILIDTGIGNKQDEKFFSHYFLHGPDSLTGSLRQHGFTEADVTDVLLTHLHFDHCGGAVNRVGERLAPAFPHARCWSNQAHWRWATQPNPREKASFLKENILPLQEQAELRWAESGTKCFASIDLLFVRGHTEGMMIPKIRYKNHVICFVADLLPSVGHIPLPYIMGYDTRPLLTLEEKESFLAEAAEMQYILFFEHDPVNECCTVKNTDRGVRVDRVFPLSEVL